MKPKKSLSVYVLFVGIFGLLIVAGFFTFQLFDEATKSQIPASQRESVKSIDGIIEQRVIDNLQLRQVISDDDILVVPATPTPTPTPEITITPISTASSEIATSEAQITTQ